MSGRLSFAFLAALVLPLVATSVAQPYVDGYYLAGAAGADLLHVDGAGKVTTVLGPSGLPPAAVGVSVANDVDNQTLMVSYQTALNTVGGVVHVDGRGNIVSTWRPSSGGTVGGVLLDQEGAFVVAIAAGGNGPAILSVDRTGREATLSAGPPVLAPVAMTTDIETGDYIVAQARGELVRVPRTGGAATPFAMLPTAIGSQISQDPTNGDIYVAVAGQTFVSTAVVRVTRAGGVTTLVTGSPFGSDNAVHLSRASASPRIAAVAFTQTAFALTHVDLSTRAVTTITSLPGFSSGSITPRHGRNTATFARGPRQWDVFLSNPADSGMNYIVALSLTPPYPGIRLPDGRQLAFAPDRLTLSGLAGTLSPLLRNYTGVLGVTGRAAAALDLRTIPQVRGVRIWILALTLDPAAPNGIRTVFDPIVLVT